MQRLPPRTHVLGKRISVATGQTLELDAFRAQLLAAGYQSGDAVWQSGQFAVRGSVIDLFPPGAEAPIRIDLFDDEIDSIRHFDPESQRSTDTVTRFDMLPAREYPTDPADLDAFRSAFRYRFAVDMRDVALYQDLKNGLHPQGLEQYLPLFFETTESLFDYLPPNPSIVIQDGAVEAGRRFADQIVERWEQRRHDVTRPVLDPEERWFTLETVNERLQAPGNVHLGDAPSGATEVVFATRAAPELDIRQHGDGHDGPLNEFMAGFSGQVLVAADTPGRREILEEALRSHGVRPRRFQSFAEARADRASPGVLVMPVETAFVADDALAVLTEDRLFAGRARQRITRESESRDPDSIIRSLADLSVGAPVVHEDHGVGRYQGLEVLDIDDRAAEFLALEYADGDRLYVPVASLHLVSRYTGAGPDEAPLHRLGGDRWAKTRRKAAERVRDVAAELLDLYARRQAREGQALALDERLYADFAAGFPFEETADQQRAIDAVIDDLTEQRPMDRLVCGDVGFGKTEVALRAAFVTVQAGQQVALLVPTTLLAQQHFNTFSDRFADWPVRVELLSRFRGKKAIDGVLNDLADGRIDIVIGTHRLLQRDIRFDRLGLVIVDEEHRFGVRHKERLKQLRAEVDLLTLTATPIPRTLNMSMSGIRDLSIIATPPARRMAVKTLITRDDPGVIREALLREIQRGGQVYFLHNEVQTIERVARDVRALVPEARVAVAHGQMAEGELERVMLDFYRQRTHVLVCTTIIESGIDVPTANTIIINRADRLGLAQLHQLRGRVGRSHHQAFAYLVTPDRRSMTPDARKRLEAIASLEELGAGFTLATHDLEIRGAGELLGEQQSGQIREVGFSLYSEMLDRAIADLKAGRVPDPEQAAHRQVDIELHLPALIPEDYLPDVNERLTLYKRIASAPDEAALRELQVEMIDRFGLLPPAVKHLFAVTELRLAADALGVRRIDVGAHGGRLEFMDETTADPAAMIRLIQSEPDRYALDGPNRLRVLTAPEPPQARIEAVRKLVERLT